MQFAMQALIVPAVKPFKTFFLAPERSRFSISKSREAIFRPKVSFITHMLFLIVDHEKEREKFFISRLFFCANYLTVVGDFKTVFIPLQIMVERCEK